MTPPTYPYYPYSYEPASPTIPSFKYGQSRVEPGMVRSKHALPISVVQERVCVSECVCVCVCVCVYARALVAIVGALVV